MGLLSILESIPVILGYIIAAILVCVATFVISARIRRTLFGTLSSGENQTGFRGFLSNFE